MRTEVQRTEVGWVDRSATGLRAHLRCGHMRVTTDPQLIDRDVRGEDLTDSGYRPGDVVECTTCPPVVIDDFKEFEGIRKALGTE